MLRPPGPRNRSIGGSFSAFRADSLGFLTKCSAEFGDLCYFRAGHQHMYYVNSPALVQEVLVTKNPHFMKSRILQRAKSLLGEGLLTNEGASHLRQRRLVQPAFHRDRLIRYAGDMSALALRSHRRYDDGAVVDIDREMMRLTLSIVGRTLFSAEVEEDAVSVGEAMNALIAMMPVLMFPLSQYLQYLPLPFMRRFQKAGETLDATIYRIIGERRGSGEDTGDLLSMLLLARDAEGDNTGMTDKQVRDETLTLFVAGHETTATALTWAWYLLAQHPDVEARMHGEIDEVLGGREPTFDDVPRLSYTDHIFAETIRLYPPAWAIGRMATTDLELGGYTVPRKSIVLLSPYTMHRSAKWWPEPGRFLPERWAADDPDRPKFAYYPFGGGPRLCIGERFAWMEGVLILAALARKWKFRRIDNKPVELAPLLTLRPKGGLKLRAEARY
ncbi:MAG: cytochrome P450 [Acidobacteria bacterium]|nr:cytochrome P450 [Acidobacteriota bacterium]